MVCARCGKEIDGDPVYAKYADKAFSGKPAWALESLALHLACFEEAEFIPDLRWETNADGEAELVDHGQVRRYRQVKG